MTKNLLLLTTVLGVLVIVSPVRSAEKESTPPTPAEKARLVKVVEGDLRLAKNTEERFYALNRAAKNALKAGQTAAAKNFAEELEKLTPQFKDNWNYGNAIQDANLVLGRLALAAGNLDEAKQRLLASAKSKGSPQMNTFGPNMSLSKLIRNVPFLHSLEMSLFSGCGFSCRCLSRARAGALGGGRPRPPVRHSDGYFPVSPPPSVATDDEHPG